MNKHFVRVTVLFLFMAACSGQLQAANNEGFDTNDLELGNKLAELFDAESYQNEGLTDHILLSNGNTYFIYGEPDCNSNVDDIQGCSDDMEESMEESNEDCIEQGESGADDSDDGCVDMDMSYDMRKTEDRNSFSDDDENCTAEARGSVEQGFWLFRTNSCRPNVEEMWKRRRWLKHFDSTSISTVTWLTDSIFVFLAKGNHFLYDCQAEACTFIDKVHLENEQLDEYLLFKGNATCVGENGYIRDYTVIHFEAGRFKNIGGLPVLNDDVSLNYPCICYTNKDGSNNYIRIADEPTRLERISEEQYYQLRLG